MAVAALLCATANWAAAPVEESVAVVPGLGLLLGCRTRWCGEGSVWVPAELIDSVVINEVCLPFWWRQSHSVVFHMKLLNTSCEAETIDSVAIKVTSPIWRDQSHLVVSTWCHRTVTLVLSPLTQS